jgi:hypothetical protein
MGITFLNSQDRADLNDRLSLSTKMAVLHVSGAQIRQTVSSNPCNVEHSLEKC